MNCLSCHGPLIGRIVCPFCPACCKRHEGADEVDEPEPDVYLTHRIRFTEDEAACERSTMNRAEVDDWP